MVEIFGLLFEVCLQGMCLSFLAHCTSTANERIMKHPKEKTCSGQQAAFGISNIFRPRRFMTREWNYSLISYLTSPSLMALAIALKGQIHILATEKKSKKKK